MDEKAAKRPGSQMSAPAIRSKIDRKLHCLAKPVHSGVSALVEKLKDAKAEVEGQRPAGAEAKGRRLGGQRGQESKLGDPRAARSGLELEDK